MLSMIGFMDDVDDSKELIEVVEDDVSPDLDAAGALELDPSAFLFGVRDSKQVTELKTQLQESEAVSEALGDELNDCLLEKDLAAASYEAEIDSKDAEIARLRRGEPAADDGDGGGTEGVEIKGRSDAVDEHDIKNMSIQDNQAGGLRTILDSRLYRREVKGNPIVCSQADEAMISALHEGSFPRGIPLSLSFRQFVRDTCRYARDQDIIKAGSVIDADNRLYFVSVRGHLENGAVRHRSTGAVTATDMDHAMSDDWYNSEVFIQLRFHIMTMLSSNERHYLVTSASVRSFERHPNYTGGGGELLPLIKSISKQQVWHVKPSETDMLCLVRAMLFQHLIGSVFTPNNLDQAVINWFKKIMPNPLVKARKAGVTRLTGVLESPNFTDKQLRWLCLQVCRMLKGVPNAKKMTQTIKKLYPEHKWVKPSAIKKFPEVTNDQFEVLFKTICVNAGITDVDYELKKTTLGFTQVDGAAIAAYFGGQFKYVLKDELDLKRKPKTVNGVSDGTPRHGDLISQTFYLMCGVKTKHWFAIKDISKVIQKPDESKTDYCTKCNKWIASLQSHNSYFHRGKKCDKCNHMNCHESFKPKTDKCQTCDKCKVTFVNETCFNAHLEETIPEDPITDVKTGEVENMVPPACKDYGYCTKGTCKLHVKWSDHECGMLKCRNCNEFHELNHLCSMKNPKPPTKGKNRATLSCDFETHARFDQHCERTFCNHEATLVNSKHMVCEAHTDSKITGGDEYTLLVKPQCELDCKQQARFAEKYTQHVYATKAEFCEAHYTKSKNTHSVRKCSTLNCTGDATGHCGFLLCCDAHTPTLQLKGIVKPLNLQEGCIHDKCKEKAIYTKISRRLVIIREPVRCIDHIDDTHVECRKFNNHVVTSGGGVDAKGRNPLFATDLDTFMRMAIKRANGKPLTLPMHNLMGYDSAFIMEWLQNYDNSRPYNVYVATEKEKCARITVELQKISQRVAPFQSYEVYKKLYIKEHPDELDDTIIQATWREATTKKASEWSEANDLDIKNIEKDVKAMIAKEKEANESFKALDVILNGTKFAQIKYGNLTFVDTYAFMQYSLRKFPKVLGFDKPEKMHPIAVEMFQGKPVNKGHFSYSWPSYAYKTKFPPKKWFEERDREANGFDEWHAKQVALWVPGVSNYDNDLEAYNIQDCMVLACGVAIFRELMDDFQRKLTPMNPLNRLVKKPKYPDGKTDKRRRKKDGWPPQELRKICSHLKSLGKKLPAYSVLRQKELLKLVLEHLSYEEMIYFRVHGVLPPDKEAKEPPLKRRKTQQLPKKTSDASERPLKRRKISEEKVEDTFELEEEKKAPAGAKYQPEPLIDVFSVCSIASFCSQVHRTYFDVDWMACIPQRFGVRGGVTFQHLEFMRSGFYGGRTENFRRHWKKDWSDVYSFCRYYDIMSLYPYLMSYCRYPCGGAEEYRFDASGKTEAELKAETKKAISFLLFEDHKCCECGEDAAFKKPEPKVDTDPLGLEEPVIVEEKYYCHTHSQGRSKSTARPDDLSVCGGITEGIERMAALEVDILPPKNLLLPVLPDKTSGKLQFDLLPKVKKVFTCVSLRKALEKDYVITRIYKGLYWNTSIRGAFKEYIDTFLKSKLTNSYKKEKHWFYDAKKDVYKDTLEARQHYCDHILKHEGIVIKPEDLKWSPEIRGVGKSMLNNLWGKYSLNMMSKRITEYYGLHDFTHKDERKLSHLHDESLKKKVKDLTINSGGRNYLQYQYKKTLRSSEAKQNYTTCLMVGLFTTAHGRMKLYQHADQLDHDQLIYADTDSLVYFTAKDKRKELELKSELGGMEDEYDEGIIITEVITLAAKSYLIRSQKAMTEMVEGKPVTTWVSSDAVKLKGVHNTNADGSYKINYPHFADLITGSEEKQHVVSQSGFTKNPENYSIKYYELEKRVRLSPHQKRWFNSNKTSYPWGYNDGKRISTEHIARLQKPVVVLTPTQELESLLSHHGINKGNDFLWITKSRRVKQMAHCEWFVYLTQVRHLIRDYFPEAIPEPKALHTVEVLHDSILAFLKLTYPKYHIMH